MDTGVAKVADVGAALVRWDGAMGAVARALNQELDFAYQAHRARTERLAIECLLGPEPQEASLKLSIVVPTFGIGVPYLKEMVASVRAQSYPNWELCICDDGDPDSATRAYLAGLARRDPRRFRVERHPKNHGIARATLTALAMATGGAVVFVDADDLLHRNALAMVAQRFNADAEVDVVYTDHDLASDLGFRRQPMRKPGWSPELLLSYNYINHLVAVRRACLDRCEGIFTDGVSGSQDWDLCFKLMGAARRVAHVPVPLYHWRQRPGSVATGDRTAKPWAYLAARRVREQHIGSLNPLVALPPAGQRREHGELCLRRDLAAERLPPLVVVNIGDDRAQDPLVTGSYRGPCRHLTVALPSGSTNGEAWQRLTGGLDQAGVSDEALVWLLDDRYAVPSGNVESLIAYAILPGVGSVWPFRHRRVRLAYTCSHDGRKLTQLSAERGPFSACSGNILTGPVHGMVVRAGTLRLGLAALTTLPESASLAAEPCDRDAMGAVVGLAMITRRFRNVACKGMRCDVALAPVPLPGSLMPGLDPYL